MARVKEAIELGINIAKGALALADEKRVGIGRYP